MINTTRESYHTYLPKDSDIRELIDILKEEKWIRLKRFQKM